MQAEAGSWVSLAPAMEAFVRPHPSKVDVPGESVVGVVSSLQDQECDAVDRQGGI